MGLSATCLFFAAGGTELLHFRTFGDSIGLKESYILLVLLCLASGLQNAAITSSSGRSVRTTHLTGLTTDLGLGSIIAFIIGSGVGAWIFLKLGYKGFIARTDLGLCSLAWQESQDCTSFTVTHEGQIIL